jgi:hypothetical protein
MRICGTADKPQVPFDYAQDRLSAAFLAIRPRETPLRMTTFISIHQQLNADLYADTAQVFDRVNLCFPTLAAMKLRQGWGILQWFESNWSDA